MFGFFSDFNLKGTPFGKDVIREIFFEHNNFIGGKYYAKLLKKVYVNIKKDGKYYAELRLSIYGKKLDEWEKLPRWAIERELLEDEHVYFMIQIPRKFSKYCKKKGGKKAVFLENFDEMLQNMFLPTFEATNEPEKSKDNKNIVMLMEHISGFDSVDDETAKEAEIFSTIKLSIKRLLVINTNSLKKA